MRKIILLVVMLGMVPASWADSTNLIATFCKQQWSGDKGMQSFCIKEKRVYRDWLKYIRKRVFNNKATLVKMDQCIYSHKPDFQKAYDCYWSSSSEDFPD